MRVKKKMEKNGKVFVTFRRLASLWCRLRRILFRGPGELPSAASEVMNGTNQPRQSIHGGNWCSSQYVSDPGFLEALERA
jgi:hypothetical protein